MLCRATQGTAWREIAVKTGPARIMTNEPSYPLLRNAACEISTDGRCKYSSERCAVNADFGLTIRKDASNSEMLVANQSASRPCPRRKGNNRRGITLHERKGAGRVGPVEAHAGTSRIGARRNGYEVGAEACAFPERHVRDCGAIAHSRDIATGVEGPTDQFQVAAARGDRRHQMIHVHREERRTVDGAGANGINSFERRADFPLLRQLPGFE